jgi:uncharacterized membrane protein
VDEKGAKELRSLQARVAALEKRLDAMQKPMVWQPVPEPQARPMPPMQPANPQMERAVRVGGALAANWLALAGILVLALGVVFALKLAYGRGWVPLEGRYAIGLVGGLALWALGDALRKRVDVRYAQALGAGGAIIAYVTVYIGYALPSYRRALGIDLETELVLLAVVSAALAAYAVWRRFELLAATAVALATVLLAPAGDFSTAGLMYAIFLDIALLLAAAWRGWLTVVWTALVGGNIAVASAIVTGDVAWQVVLGSLLALNGAAVLATLRGRGAAHAATTYQAGAAILVAAIETGAVLDDAGLDRLEHPFAWAFLAFGVLGLLVGTLLRKHGMGPAMVGTGLLLAWAPLQFEDELVRITLAYAGLGAVALAAGHAWPSAAVRLGGRIAALLAWALGVLVLQAAGSDDVFEEQKVLATLAAAALGLGAGAQWALERRGPVHAAVAYVGLAASLAAVLIALAFDLSGWAITVSWAVLGLIVVVAGLALRIEELRLASFAVFAFVLLRIFTFDIAQLSVVGRALAFLATGALLLVAAFLYARNRRQPA